MQIGDLSVSVCNFAVAVREYCASVFWGITKFPLMSFEILHYSVVFTLTRGSLLVVQQMHWIGLENMTNALQYHMIAA